MMTVTERASYLKGLVDMAHFEKETDEVKIIKALIDVIDEMALSISDLEDELAVAQNQIDAVDEDLGDLEEFVYDDDDDECDCCDDEDYFEVECPSCGEKICLDESMLDEESIECPSCGEILEFDFDDDCDCCDCNGEDDKED